MVQELTMDLPADDVETIAVSAFKPLALPGMAWPASIQPS